MARAFTFTVPTRLWSESAGWVTFDIGEQDPGGAWFEQEGGIPAGSAATAGLLKEMAALQGQIEARDTTLARKDHDLAQMERLRAAAVAEVAGLEQRAIEAERLEAEAHASAASVTKQRDDLAAQLHDAKAKLAKFDHDGDGKVGGSKPKVSPGL